MHGVQSEVSVEMAPERKIETYMKFNDLIFSTVDDNLT